LIFVWSSDTCTLPGQAIGTPAGMCLDIMGVREVEFIDVLLSSTVQVDCQ